MTVQPPTGDTRIYVASARQGIPAHRPTGDGITRCGRSTRSGLIYRADAAIADLHVAWCPPCWTPGAGLDRTPGTPAPGSTPERIPADSIWREIADPAKRLRIKVVSPTQVQAKWTYSIAGGAFGDSKRTVVVARADWYRLYRRETAADLGAVLL